MCAGNTLNPCARLFVNLFYGPVVRLRLRDSLVDASLLFLLFISISISDTFRPVKNTKQISVTWLDLSFARFPYAIFVRLALTCRRCVHAHTRGVWAGFLRATSGGIVDILTYLARFCWYKTVFRDSLVFFPLWDKISCLPLQFDFSPPQSFFWSACTQPPSWIFSHQLPVVFSKFRFTRRQC